MDDDFSGFRSPFATGLDNFSQYDLGRLTPNQDAGPSSASNSPTVTPILDPRVKGNLNMLDKTSNEANIGFDEGKLHTPQGPLNDLMSLRRDFPFLPIMPFPALARSMFLTNAGQAVDFRLPNGAALAYFKGNNPWFMSIHGAATVPSATNAQSPTNYATDTGNENSSFMSPEGVWWYVRGVQTVSMVSAVAGAIVTGLFYIPSEWPHN
jgi:hypothetical protein